MSKQERPGADRRGAAGFSVAVPEGCEGVADQSREARIQADYVQRLNALVDDANANGTIEILVDGLTWTLARVIVYLDSAPVTGDILRRLGQHVGTLAAKRTAQRELDDDRERGIAPN